jgi:mono/diheme cytochrome c family protein
MGEAVDASFSQMRPYDVHAIVAYLRTVPAASSPDLPATLAGPAPVSPRQGMVIADARGRQVFEGACVSCHDWTGVSPIIPLATLTGARAVNDPSAVNVAQIVISGARRMTAQGVETMPPFGRTYSDSEIAAVANYVTSRFGTRPSHIGAAQVAVLRKASAQ